ncbi:MAG: threonine/serine dehydratase [Lautropia sp.]
MSELLEYTRAGPRGRPAHSIAHAALGPLRVPVWDDVRRAEGALAGRIVRTPLLRSSRLDDLAGGFVWLKAESLQSTSSFKARGALNALLTLTPAQRQAGVVAYSTGNHGQAIAWAARQLSVPATIVMPHDAPANKIERALAHEAEIVRYDRARESREAIGMRLLRERGGTLIPPGDHPEVLAAQGTVAIEVWQQLPPVAQDDLAVFAAPCGGGGLMAGCALVINELSASTQLCAVEPASFDDTVRSLLAGRRESNPPSATSFCDALQASTPAELPFEINRHLLDRALGVTESEVQSAVKFAVEELRLVVEPGGAVALAAALNGRLPLAGRHAVVVLSGGNIDTPLLTDFLAA